MIRTGKHAYNAPAASCLLDDTESDELGDEAGFTLVEAVVALTIFAIITAAAVTAIVTGIKTSNANRDRVTAANVAQQALADVQATPAASLRPDITPVTTTTPVGNRSYTVARQVTVEASSAPSASAPAVPSACPSSIVSGTAYWLHVSVRVTWNGGPAQGISMDTVRTC